MRGTNEVRLARWVMVVLAVGGATLAACASDDGGASAPSRAAAVSTPAAPSSPGTDAITTDAPTVTVSPTDAPADTEATDAPASTAAPETTSAAQAQALAFDALVVDTPVRAGATREHYEIGPIDIQPGQNNIAYSRNDIPKPEVDGFITRIAPNLRFEDGTVPGVDVVHLHHGVWLNVSASDATTPGLPERFFAAGEEKTTMVLPDGYGYGYRTTDNWVVNYMIHNLYPIQRKVWITYDIDFIPASDPAAAGLTPARPVWTDVQNGSVYPVFDVIRGTGGADGEYTYPNEATAPYPGVPLNQWTVDRDGVLLATAGHLHPGGLHTDLWLTRAGETTHLFQSVAKYYEPAGAVSWDVSMTATPSDWRVQVRAGDVIGVDATYDSASASWYESMGIMVVWMADTSHPGDVAAADPFVTPVDVDGVLTHGHLAENDNHGGGPATEGYINLVDAPSEPAKPQIGISGYVYEQGDMLAGTAVPTISPGGTIEYNNIDAPLDNGVWHTITACKAPCDRATGIAYPLADADIPFDSGELGAVGPPTAGRVTWSTPSDLPAGTYTFFCRIHPSMRGAFRVAEGADG